MPAAMSHFAVSDKSAKVPAGPTLGPSPGPTLQIAVAAAEMAVMKSRPVADRAIAKIRKLNRNRKKKPVTDWIKAGEIFCPS